MEAHNSVEKKTHVLSQYCDDENVRYIYNNFNNVYKRDTDAVSRQCKMYIKKITYYSRMKKKKDKYNGHS